MLGKVEFLLIVAVARFLEVRNTTTNVENKSKEVEPCQRRVAMSTDNKNDHIERRWAKRDRAE